MNNNYMEQEFIPEEEITSPKAIKCKTAICILTVIALVLSLFAFISNFFYVTEVYTMDYSGVADASAYNGDGALTPKRNQVVTISHTETEEAYSYAEYETYFDYEFEYETYENVYSADDVFSADGFFEYSTTENGTPIYFVGGSSDIIYVEGGAVDFGGIPTVTAQPAVPKSETRIQFYIPNIFQIIMALLYFVPSLIFALYIFAFSNRPGAHILVQIAMLITAVSLVVGAVYSGYYMMNPYDGLLDPSMLLVNLISLALPTLGALLLAYTAVMGFSNKVFLYVASAALILPECFFMFNMFSNNVSEVSTIRIILLVAAYMARIAFCLAVFLFGATNRIPYTALKDLFRLRATPSQAAETDEV